MATERSLMSEECFDFICTNCDSNGKIVEAVRYCVECCGYCCQTCTDIHTTILMLKNHNLLDTSHGNQASNKPTRLPEFPTEQCDQHKGKVVDMYCEEHNEVGCCICISAHYKSCPEKSIYSVPDLIDNLFKLGDCKQIQSRLTDMMVLLADRRKSKNDKLQALKGSKTEEIQKVMNFQKSLEAVIKKAGEASRNEIENKYQELEKEILAEMQDVEGTVDSIKESDDKLKKAESNRAQRFVCSKISEKRMKEANRHISKQTRTTNGGLLFTPNQALMKYLSGLQGIGAVGVNTEKKTDLYKITGSKDINIKLMEDSKQCGSAGCCLTFDNQLLVTDYSNNKLKLIDINTMTVIDSCTLCQPYGVCCISDQEAAVACGGSKIIQFVTYGKKMTPTRQIKTSHFCYGITSKDDQLCVTDIGSSVHIYDTTGNMLKSISQDTAVNALFSNSRHLTFSKSKDKLYICDCQKGIVSLDGAGNYHSTFNDRDLSSADGVCVDGRQNIFVIGCGSHNVMQFNEEGEKIGVVIKQHDGLQQQPRSVCFHDKLNRLFVTMNYSDEVKMFELH